MKNRISLFLLFFYGCAQLNAQQLQAAFLEGDLLSRTAGVYGTKGVNSNPHPEALANACMWSSNGAIYMFGGEINGTFNGTGPRITGRFWKWDVSEGWVSLAAPLADTYYVAGGWFNANPVYGSLGVSDESNYPGARVGAAYATGSNGKLYMYGGFGAASDGVGALSDLWEYDPATAEWTWIAGSDLKDQVAVHHSSGASSNNFPGARIEANLWVDNAGDIWIFGGGTGGYDQLNDNYNSLMKFDGSNWNWVDGSSSLNDPGSASEPSARRSAAGVYASDGKFYLFGGTDNESVSNNYNRRSDFWSFDGSSWSLEDGTANADNEIRGDIKPLADAQLVELNGEIFLQGGYNGYYGGTGFDVMEMLQWNAGSSSFESVTMNGTLSASPGVYSSSAYPEYNSLAINSGAMTAVLNNEVYFFGGREYFLSSNSNNLFVKFNGQSFAYLSGGEQIGTERTGPATEPGSRYGAGFTFNQDEEVLYIYGGNVYTGAGSASYGDLWRYQNGEWVWISGSSTAGVSPVYSGGTLSPGAREWAKLWTDVNGDLWLFGGYGPDKDGNLGRLNDLWKYDVSADSWSWIKGSDTRDAISTKGTQGLAATANTPGGRIQSLVWQNAAGDVYLYGGLGISSSGSLGRMNDFWKWDGNDWTWMAGTDALNDQGALSASPNSPDAGNYPGARSATCNWGDDNGFYMYGGQGISSGGFGYLDQLWYYEASSGHWAMLSGSTTAKDVLATYGEATDNDASVSPGNLRSAMMWSDGSDVYVFGGVRWEGSSYLRNNNLWHWDGNEWAWLKGGKNNSYTSMIESAGSEFDASFEYLPSAKESSVYWSNGNSFYLFGGLSLASGSSQRMSDLWVLEEGNSWDGSTWSKGGPVSSGESGVILSNSAITDTTLQVDNLLVDADFTFDLNDKTLNIAGDIYNYGAWSKIGAIYLNGGQTQSLLGSEWAMDGILIVESGTTFETGDSLLVKANSVSDYGQVYSEGTVNGELEFEYYLDLPTETNNGRYFHMGSVLDNVNISDFKVDGILNTGNANNSVNTVWEWDASLSNWDSPTDGNMTAGAGYAVYAGNANGNNFIFSDGTNPGTISIRGDYPDLSLFSKIIYYDDGVDKDGNPEMDFAGGTNQAAAEGWNFYANPFPFNIDVSNVLNLYGVSTVYLWNSANYSTYNQVGTATNGGTGIIAPGQGFWLQNSSGIIANKNWDVPAMASVASSSQRYKSNNLDGIRISLTNPTDSFIDDIWLAFKLDAKSGFDSKYDAWNIGGSGMRIPDLSFKVIEGSLAVSTIHPDTVNEVFININAHLFNQDTLFIEVDLKDLQSFSSVYLEDLALDILHDLKDSNNYQFVHDTTFDAKRFQLHFGHSSGLGQKLREYNSALYFYEAGEGVYLKWQKGEEQIAELSIFNASGALVSRQNWISKQALLILENEPKGMYTAQLISEDGETHNIKILKRN